MFRSKVKKITSTKRSLSFEVAVFVQPNILARWMKPCLFRNTHELFIIVFSANFVTQLVVTAYSFKKCYRLLALLGSVVEGARLSFFEHDDCIEFGNDLVIDLMSGVSEDHGLSVSIVS